MVVGSRSTTRSILSAGEGEGTVEVEVEMIGRKKGVCSMHGTRNRSIKVKKKVKGKRAWVGVSVYCQCGGRPGGPLEATTDNCESAQGGNMGRFMACMGDTDGSGEH